LTFCYLKVKNKTSFIKYLAGNNIGDERGVEKNREGKNKGKAMRENCNNKELSMSFHREYNTLKIFIKERISFFKSAPSVSKLSFHLYFVVRVSPSGCRK